jgi:hypothetical protein
MQNIDKGQLTHFLKMTNFYYCWGGALFQSNFALLAGILFTRQRNKSESCTELYSDSATSWLSYFVAMLSCHYDIVD